MVHVPRHRRLTALALIAITNFGFYTLPIRLLNPEKAAILISMVVAVAVAFLISALSHLIRLERIMIKYVISGGVGIGMGVVLFFLLKSSTILTMEWVNSNGKLLLIGLNLIAALFLFFAKKEGKRPRAIESDEGTKAIASEKASGAEENLPMETDGSQST